MKPIIKIRDLPFMPTHEDEELTFTSTGDSVVYKYDYHHTGMIVDGEIEVEYAGDVVTYTAPGVIVFQKDTEYKLTAKRDSSVMSIVRLKVEKRKRRLK